MHWLDVIYIQRKAQRNKLPILPHALEKDTETMQDVAVWRNWDDFQRQKIMSQYDPRIILAQW
jgi:hypothetical protein